MPRASLLRVGAIGVAVLAFALLAGPASAQKLRQPSAGSALAKLQRQTNALPSSAASKKQKAKLKKAAATARRSARKEPCTSVRQLATFRRVLRGIKIKKGKRNRKAANKLRALGPASLAASRALIASPRTKRCGGGVKPSKLEDVKTTILQNDANGMKVKFDLPAMRFVDEEGAGRTWTKLVLPDTDSPAQPGSPGIPMVTNTLAVPEGATLKVQATDTSSYTLDGVDVFPAQPQPMDAGPPPDFTKPPYSTPPFLVDNADYRKRGSQPAAAADGVVLGQSRDVTLGNLQVAAAQYDAADKKLKVFNSVTVTVAFEGGSHKFSDQLSSPWEQPQRRLIGGLFNRDAVPIDIAGLVGRCGEEMLVITSPATRAQADTFATAKRAQGMRTNVAETGAGPGQIGTTPAEIQTVIRSHLTAADCVHPSYITILGDDELVPTFPGIFSVESDLEYSLKDSADEMPDVAVGRIVGDDATGVGNAITKIISYENAPPDGQWLRKATVAANFQDNNADGQEDRTFVLFAETARNGLLDAPGFGLTVDRIYDEAVSGTPLKLNDGTDLPAALKKPTFAWDGDTADISTAWNEGRYLMIHRDHGWTGGWSGPQFTDNDADRLTNGAMLPVVLSINCSSGGFQNDDRSFATQALVNPNGGAAGVFGDTEDSPTSYNTQLALGFLDALVPRVLPAEGTNNKLRTGEALIRGKQRLAGIWAPSGPGITGGNDATRSELYLWHYFGDPSMQMWGGEGIKYPVITDFRAAFDKDAIGPPRPDPPPYGVRVTLPPAFNGQPFALLRNGQVVGKGVAADGQAIIPAAFDTSQPKPGDLLVAFEGDGAVPIQIQVEGIPEPPKEEPPPGEPPPPPPGPKANTQTTITCPVHTGTNNGTATINGKLTPGFPGARIDLTYQPRTDAMPPGPAVHRTQFTNALGEWNDQFNTGANDPGGKGDGGFWTVTARFPGDAGHNASPSVSCQFLEPNN
jgi:hypothetical protein